MENKTIINKTSRKFWAFIVTTVLILGVGSSFNDADALYYQNIAKIEIMKEKMQYKAALLKPSHMSKMNFSQEYDKSSTIVSNDNIKAKILSVKSLKGLDISKVLIKISANDKNLQDVKVLIMSDTDYQKLTINSLDAHKSTLINTILKVENPDSVKIHISESHRESEISHLRHTNPTQFG